MKTTTYRYEVRLHGKTLAESSDVREAQKIATERSAHVLRFPGYALWIPGHSWDQWAELVG